MIKAGADLGFVRNSSALIVLERQGETYTLVHEREWIPVDKPLRPRVVIDEIVAACRKRRCDVICSDIHYVADLSTQLEDTGVELMQFCTLPAEISRAWFVLKDLLSEGKLDLRRGSDRLREQLQGVLFKPAAAGYFQIIQPEVSGAHGDVAQALVHALYAFGGHQERELTAAGGRRFATDDNDPGKLSLTLEEYLEANPDSDY